MPPEADTCRTLILPRLYAADWTDDQVAEQRTLTDGRIVVGGQRGAGADQCAEVSQQLANRGMDFQDLDRQTGKPEADPFDLTCYLAFNASILTRRQRADRVKKERSKFFTKFAPESRQILEELLEKYAADGELQFSLPEVLQLPPISLHGQVGEIIHLFGGADQLRNAVRALQAMLYAA